MRLQYGLNIFPETCDTAYGARWIFPNDHIWDRADFVNPASENGQKLSDWLDNGAFRKARTNVPSDLSRSDDIVVTLYEDEIGLIKASPRRSFGYLYVCAYLRQPSDGPFIPVKTPRRFRRGTRITVTRHLPYWTVLGKKLTVVPGDVLVVVKQEGSGYMARVDDERRIGQQDIVYLTSEEVRSING